jgi:hypothetical protein
MIPSFHCGDFGPHVDHTYKDRSSAAKPPAKPRGSPRNARVTVVRIKGASSESVKTSPAIVGRNRLTAASWRST